MDGSQTFQNVTNCLQQFINQCENEKQAFKQQCEQKFKEFRERLERSTQQTLENERRVLRDLRQALDDEIASMQKLPARQNDVVSVNCGGKTLMVKRSTLCAVEGSVLASMFSGRWEDSLEKDDKGNVFCDFNPDCFERIVNHLRLRLIEDPAKPSPAPNIPSHLRTEFNALVQYLGMETIFQAVAKPEPSSSLHFKPLKGAVMITEDGTTVTRTSKEQGKCISLVQGIPARDVIEFSVLVQNMSSKIGVGFMIDPKSPSPMDAFLRTGIRLTSNSSTLCLFFNSGRISFGDSQQISRGYAVGDVVKCSFVFSSRQLSFSVNGSLVHSSKINARAPLKYPCVRLSSYGDSVKIIRESS